MKMQDDKLSLNIPVFCLLIEIANLAKHCQCFCNILLKLQK